MVMLLLTWADYLALKIIYFSQTMASMAMTIVELVIVWHKKQDSHSMDMDAR